MKHLSIERIPRKHENAGLTLRVACDPPGPSDHNAHVEIRNGKVFGWWIHRNSGRYLGWINTELLGRIVQELIKKENWPSQPYTCGN